MFGNLFGRKQTLSDFETQTMPYSDLLFGAALRMTRDEARAEDLVQETYLRAYRFWHRYEQGTNLKAWLLRIQTNEFINRYRKQKREKAVFDVHNYDTAIETYSDEDTASLPPEVRTKFLTELMGDEVIAALDKLPMDFRMVVMLVDINDLSYKEVAEVLDCPVGTVMSRLHRARKLMRSSLFEYAIDRGIFPKPSQQPEHVASLQAYRMHKAGTVK
jgi:RNA polymerase sigma-70 factor (ECF subfamily)